MSKKDRPKTTVELSSEQVKRLQEYATEFGFFHTRGPGTGWLGSISQLLQAIADGEIELVRKVKK